MNMVKLVQSILFILVGGLSIMTLQAEPNDEYYDLPAKELKPVVRPDSEWAQLLPPEVYAIMREAKTERAFSGRYDKFDEKGVYHCAACGNALFSSEKKFDSKSGWPSFWWPIARTSVSYHDDTLLFLIKRTEIRCKKCDSHLGHVFDDGPAPTHKRYCINSLALAFKQAGHSH